MQSIKESGSVKIPKRNKKTECARLEIPSKGVLPVFRYLIMNLMINPVCYIMCEVFCAERKANTLTLAVGASFLFPHYTKQAEPPLRAWFLCVVHSKLEEEFPPNFCHSNLNSHLKYM